MNMFQRFFSAALVLPFFFSYLYAGTVITVSVSGSSAEMEQLNHTQLKLQKFQKGNYTDVDSAFFKAGKATFTANETEVAFYKITGNGFAELSLIVSAKEEKIFVAGSLLDFKLGSYIFFESRENQCLLKVKAAETELARTYFNIIPKSRNTTDKLQLTRLSNQFQAAQKLFNTKTNDIAMAYPDCFCAAFVVPNLKSAVQTDASQSIDSFFLLHALDSLKTEDERLLSFPNFFDMLKAYRNNFVPKTGQGQKTFIDVVFRQKTLHGNIRSFLFNYYLQVYTADRQPELVAYLLDANKQLQIDTTTADGMLAGSIKKLLPGNVAYNAVLKNEKEQAVSVGQTFEGADYGVILLYNHECDHCLELIPQIQAIVDSSKHNIKVYAIDTHHEKAGWLQFISEKKLPFTHVFLSPEMGNTIATKYAMLSIPIMIITDGKLNIISRFATPDMLKSL